MEILNKIDRFQKEINGLRPMEGDMLRLIQDDYRVGLTWTSNALEGNSLTESETKVLQEDGLTVGGNRCGTCSRRWTMRKPMIICFPCFRTDALMSRRC